MIKLRSKKVKTLAVSAVAGLVAFAAPGALLSVNFINDSGNGTLSGDAGAAGVGGLDAEGQATLWNNMDYTASLSSFTLEDSSTTSTFSISISGTSTDFGGDGASNKLTRVGPQIPGTALLTDFLTLTDTADVFGANQKYDLIVYIGDARDDDNSAVDVFVTHDTETLQLDIPVSSPSSDTEVLVEGVHYVRFSGLDTSSGATNFSFQKSAVAVNGDRVVLGGVQMVAIPEPSSLSFALVAGAASLIMLKRRHR